jgi:hypothetical protein
MKQSVVGRLDLYIGAAALAAHASFLEEGFRIRDLAFFLELFLNWSSDFESHRDVVQTTQLSRYVAQLVSEGFAKRYSTKMKGGPIRDSLRKEGSRGVQSFRLTRLGLLELLTRMTSTQHPLPPAQTFFRLSFLKGYRPWLERLVEQGSSQIPPALAMELAALLDVDTLIVHEIKRLERAIERLEGRIRDAEQTSVLTNNRLAAGVVFDEVVREVERRFPYELNSMKPLHELISSINPDQRCWELQRGGVLRAAMMWEPQRAMLREMVRQLVRLRGRG